MKRCFFIGHRDASHSVVPSLSSAIEKHICQYGVEEFLVGHYGKFDRYVCAALAEAQTRHPSIRLYLLTPYHPAVRPIELPVGFHGTIYPPDMEIVPRRYAIVHANRYAVNYSDFLIAHVQYTPSNTADLVEYARKKTHCAVTVI